MPLPRVLHAEDLDRALMAADAGKQDLVLDRLLTSWVRSDAPAAARYSELQADPFLREVAQRAVALRWAELDHEAAERWAASLGDELERARAISAVALTLGETDPRGAVALIARHEGELDAASRLGVLARWASRDFEGAQDWLEAQPPGSERDALVQRLTFQRARTEPAEAVDLANRLIADEATRREAIISIIRPWSLRDADAVRSWAASADEETRRRIEAEFALGSQGGSK